MQVNVLGCGSATPTFRHQPSCQVVNNHDKLFMIDCGEGAQLQFRRLGLKFSRLRHIFISHLHGDHLFGLPGLLSTMDLHDIGGEVTIHIHPQGIKMLKDFMGHFVHDGGMKIVYDPIQPGQRGVLYEDKSLIISTFPLRHRIPSNGFLFQEKPKLRHIIGDMVKFHNVPVAQMQAIKEGADFITQEGKIIPNNHLTCDPDPAVSFAYCSDTSPSPDILEDIHDVTLLYHEATYDNSLAAQAHERGHSTAREAAEMALQAHAHQLMIGHYSKRYLTEEELLREAQAIFPNTILADEGKVVDVQ